ncbi:hypothetical protein V7O66_08310 [Methanolobus sp. ZRKC3]|uniref:hypothetical protein n=1 Tax=Methanolobus sp. ZRKC3 TaxID=3125786 RepID=UPI003243227B
MGFEVTVVLALFFISAVVVGTLSFTTLTSSSELVSDASIQQNQIHSKLLQTDITINNLVTSNASSPYDLTVTLTNTGSETLQFDELNVLIDGEIKTYNFNDTAAVWTPDETRDLVVPDLSGSGAHRVKVVTENGIADYSSYSL